MRTIIRYSLDGDYGSKLGQKLTKILGDAGFVHLEEKTATYECTNISVSQLGQALQSFWDTANEFSETVTLDHFWMYSDKRTSS